MFAFNDILQKIEQEITRLQFTYPPKSLYDPIEYILSVSYTHLTLPTILRV